MHNQPREHFLTFTTTLRQNKKHILLWFMVWFAIIWKIWIMWNRVIFQVISFDYQQAVDLVKVHMW